MYAVYHLKSSELEGIGQSARHLNGCTEIR